MKSYEYYLIERFGKALFEQDDKPKEDKPKEDTKAKDSSKKDPVLDSTIKNTDTGNDIKVRTALGSDYKGKAVQKAAQAVVAAAKEKKEPTKDTTPKEDIKDTKTEPKKDKEITQVKSKTAGPPPEKTSAQIMSDENEREAAAKKIPTISAPTSHPDDNEEDKLFKADLAQRKHIPAKIKMKNGDVIDSKTLTPKALAFELEAHDQAARHSGFQGYDEYVDKLNNGDIDDTFQLGVDKVKSKAKEEPPIDEPAKKPTVYEGTKKEIEAIKTENKEKVNTAAAWTANLFDKSDDFKNIPKKKREEVLNKIKSAKDPKELVSSIMEINPKADMKEVAAGLMVMLNKGNKYITKESSGMNSEDSSEVNQLNDIMEANPGADEMANEFSDEVDKHDSGHNYNALHVMGGVAILAGIALGVAFGPIVGLAALALGAGMMSIGKAPGIDDEPEEPQTKADQEIEDLEQAGDDAYEKTMENLAKDDEPIKEPKKKAPKKKKETTTEEPKKEESPFPEIKDPKEIGAALDSAIEKLNDKIDKEEEKRDEIKKEKPIDPKFDLGQSLDDIDKKIASLKDLLSQDEKDKEALKKEALSIFILSNQQLIEQAIKDSFK